MDKAIEVFSKELSSLRTGRANASMLDLIKVDVYGQQMPINQVGSITTPEARMINIQIWDSNNVQLESSKRWYGDKFTSSGTCRNIIMKLVFPGVADPIRLGLRKPDATFREHLKEIKRKHRSTKLGNINTF